MTITLAFETLFSTVTQQNTIEVFCTSTGKLLMRVTARNFCLETFPSFLGQSPLQFKIVNASQFAYYFLNTSFSILFSLICLFVTCKFLIWNRARIERKKIPWGGYFNLHINCRAWVWSQLMCTQRPAGQYYFNKFVFAKQKDFYVRGEGQSSFEWNVICL